MQKRKHSVRVQFAAIFIGLMAATILLCWLMNRIFLEDYYISNKQEVLQDIYGQLNEAAVNENIKSANFDLTLQRLSSTYNVNVLIVDADSSIVKATVLDPDLMLRQLLNYMFLRKGSNEENTHIIEETETYRIQNVRDPDVSINYIEMLGILKSGDHFILRTPLEGIQDSAAIANRFMAYSGMLGIVISGLIFWYVSKKITDPISELSRISERMIHLDFDAKYHGREKTDNEIAQLGRHINQLSMALESTISELKTANNELKKDIEKKEEVDEMRKEFLANVSHELKTPIALIQGYAEGLKEGINDDQESREFYCEVIMDEAGKMNEMVKKLLTLNQLESGSDVVTMERFDLAGLVRNYVQSASLLALQNGIAVQVEEMAPTYVWGDEFKIEEVLMNYFSNAVNHASGDKVIEIKLTRRGGKVRVSVFNTGEPIPEEALPYLGEKFYKVDKARTREYGGSGIGLSIVKAIMKSMNQDYGVINYDNGVEFWFELEAVTEEE